MHRPIQRRDALRERVFAGRQQRNAQRRRAAVARKGGRRMVALFAGLAMVASVITATQLASNALEGREGGLGAGECLEDPAQQADPEGENQAAAAAEEEAASGEAPELTSTEELEAHEEDGHIHYRRPGWREDPPPETPDPGESSPPASPDPSEEPPAEECEEGEGGEGGEDPGEGDPGEGGDRDRKSVV